MKTRFLILLLAVLLAPFTGCPRISDLEIPMIMGPKVSDEDQILTILDDVQRGVESKRVYKVLAHVSRNYYDQEGRDYIAIQAYLNQLFKEYRDIRIMRTRPRVVIEGARARAFETFGTQAKPVNPVSGRPIDVQGRVTVFLEKTGGTWQIVEWGPIQ